MAAPGVYSTDERSMIKHWVPKASLVNGSAEVSFGNPHKYYATRFEARWHTPYWVEHAGSWIGHFFQEDDPFPTFSLRMSPEPTLLETNWQSRNWNWWIEDIREKWSPVHTLRVPLWMPFVMAAIPGCLLWRVEARHHSRARAGLCPFCGYPRRGLPTSAPCPECGHSPTPATPSR